MPTSAAPARPTASEVEDAVTHIVAGFVGVHVDAIDRGWVLQDPPLAFDDNRLAYLAMSVRGYVRSYAPDATVTAADARKPGLTVAGLGALAARLIG